MAERSFAQRVFERLRTLDNPTVLGLDPDLGRMPAALRAAAAAGPEAAGRVILDYNLALLDAVQDIVGFVKPQVACYERHGLAGMEALAATIRAARERGFLVIADGKRNDIGSSSAAYAAAWLGGAGDFDADALTVNAYLGWDGIKPFVDACVARGRGIFVLVRTSNPSATELQDLELGDGRRVYEAMGDLVAAWNAPHVGGSGVGGSGVGGSGYGPVGAVVGATWPEQARKLRQRLPGSLILVPGYGAQGATADDCAASFDERGEGALVNASRSLMYAWQKEGREADFAAATRDEALRMRDALRLARDRHLGTG
ncbi:MAG: orotidine-5'-phosphate decarboxylase [Bacillota bacterium]|nr:orotidine-5'-phosphate decarboxylase [Bacillota bacterium]